MIVVTLLISLVEVAAISVKAGRLNCSPSDASYSNMLKGNNVSSLLDKKCENGICFAYLNPNESERCKNLECDDNNCQQFKSKDLEFARLMKQMNSDISNLSQFNLPKRQSLHQQPNKLSQLIKNQDDNLKTVSTNQESAPELSDVVTVFKTEVKTVTANVPRKNEIEDCIGDCLENRKRNAKKMPKKVQSNIKTNKPKENFDSNSICSDDQLENSTYKEGLKAQKFNSSTLKGSYYNPISGINSTNQDVTVTQVIEKTKTVDKPLTLYREMTTTVTIEKPLINYKITTFTKISTQVESVTVTKFKNPNATSNESTSNIAPTNDPLEEHGTEEDKVMSTFIPKNSPSKSLNMPKNKEPKTITVFRNQLQQTDEAPAITITKILDSSAQTPSESSNKVADHAEAPKSFITKIVTVDNTQATVQPSLVTITSTVTRNASNKDEVPVEKSKTEVPPVSISTVTKTVTGEAEKVNKSSECVSTVTVTEKPKKEMVNGESKELIASKAPATSDSNKIQKKISCDDVFSCFNIPNKGPKKALAKENAPNITKAIAKGCEVTSDVKKTRPRTICRFTNISNKKPVKSGRKKRTVFKTVYADDEDSTPRHPKTISA